jgi:hypothetical protein
MTLQEYLSAYFNKGEEGFISDSVVNLFDHFSTKFGVMIKNVGNLYQFKYNQIEAKWSFPITHESRGVILEYDMCWKYIGRPFTKFFNLHEGYCPIFNEKDYQEVYNNLTIVEKVDGTCILLYNYKDSWRVSTLGSIPTGNVGDFPFTFGELFFKTLNVNIDELNLDKGKTYIFELACVENRIVTRYSENIVVLLGIRDNLYGVYDDVHIQEEVVLRIMEKGGNCRMPYRLNLYTLDVRTFEGLKKYVEGESLNIDKYGDNSEGFVIYDGFKPIAKVKNMRYLTLHNISGGDIGHSLNNCIDLFFIDKIDDYISVIPDVCVRFVEELKLKYLQLISKGTDCYNNFIKGKVYATRKDYAIMVQKNIPKEFLGFFFEKYSKIFSDSFDFDGEFRFWIKDNYKKFESYWKN